MWACMAAIRTGSLVCLGDVTAHRRSKMNSEVYRAVVSPHFQPNAVKLIGGRFRVQMGKHSKRDYLVYFLSSVMDNESLSV